DAGVGGGRDRCVRGEPGLCGRARRGERPRAAAALQPDLPARSGGGGAVARARAAPRPRAALERVASRPLNRRSRAPARFEAAIPPILGGPPRRAGCYNTTGNMVKESWYAQWTEVGREAG